MWKLCKYKNALGVPGKGLHSYRIFNIPIFDVLFTILGARILQIVIFPENHYLHILGLLFQPVNLASKILIPFWKRS